MLKTLYRQFSRPEGVLGHLAGWIMARRPSNVERNRWTVELLDLQPDDRVLEIGFGPGLSLAHVWTRIASGQGSVVGLDHSDVMLTQAARRNREALAAPTSRMTLIRGGFEGLSGLNRTFDKVFSVNVLQFARDREATLATLRGCLNPGGILATTHQPRHSGAKPDDAGAFGRELASQMSEAGFIDVRVEELALRPIPAVCVLGGIGRVSGRGVAGWARPRGG